MRVPPGVPARWRTGLREVARWEWDHAQGGDPGSALEAFLDEHGLAGDIAAQSHDRYAVGLLVGAAACARIAGCAAGPPTPAGRVPELVAVAFERAPAPPSVAGVDGTNRPFGPSRVGRWHHSWSAARHRSVIELVRAAIARGDVYQANVVGHRSAPCAGDPLALAAAVAALPGATYGGVLAGDGWAVGSASPEQLVSVVDGRVTTRPVKGTWGGGVEGARALRASEKDRAEHVMIVDLARNDVAQVARNGTVEVDELFRLVDWSGLWQAESTVAADLADGVTALAVLRALAPGGSVTGAPKHAACEVLAELEPVGRGPAMGAFGFLWAGGLDLGLSIRTVAVEEDHEVHVWAGGGITWGSDAGREVAEADAKAAPVVAALERAGG
jgi:para-aminobenzoate synthetase component 1